MRKFTVLAALLASFAFAVPALADNSTSVPGAMPAPSAQGDYNPKEHKAKLLELADLEDTRANDLVAIVAHDHQIAKDLHSDAAMLNRHATSLHDKAEEFKNLASLVPAGQAKSDLNGFAKEMQTFAGRDRRSAAWREKQADSFEKQAEETQKVRDWHIDHAKRLRDAAGRINA